MLIFRRNKKIDLLKLIIKGDQSINILFDIHVLQKVYQCSDHLLTIVKKIKMVIFSTYTIPRPLVFATTRWCLILLI